ncbi:hypothetical protein IBTHAUMO2_570002 [Nitrosopumilaceae archaeon]|nr:hypothetical protein IBTHAUMO2_570002 [Nitrosopumilaceae archaeon]
MGPSGARAPPGPGGGDPGRAVGVPFEYSGPEYVRFIKWAIDFDTGGYRPRIRQGPGAGIRPQDRAGTKRGTGDGAPLC